MFAKADSSICERCDGIAHGSGLTLYEVPVDVGRSAGEFDVAEKLGA